MVQNYANNKDTIGINSPGIDLKVNLSEQPKVKIQDHGTTTGNNSNAKNLYVIAYNLSETNDYTVFKGTTTNSADMTELNNSYPDDSSVEAKILKRITRDENTNRKVLSTQFGMGAKKLICMHLLQMKMMNFIFMTNLTSSLIKLVLLF